MTIFPNEQSFPPEHVGKFLVSTTQDDSYYATYQLDENGLDLNGKVRIRVYVPKEFYNTKIYYRLKDPDDPSEYETDTEGYDNLCKGEEALSSITDKANELGDLNGEEHAFAEVVLPLPHCSGENFIVRASPIRGFDNPYVVETPVLTSWKRIYAEYDFMFKKGTFLSASFNADNKPNYDQLFVQQHEDFSNGNDLIIFQNDGNSYTTILQHRGNSTNKGPFLRVDPLNNNEILPKYSGIIITNEDETTELDDGLVKDGYGDGTGATNSDGAFVEFTAVPINNNPYEGRVPKFKSLDNFITDVGLRKYYAELLNHWSNYANKGDNVVHVTAADFCFPFTLFGWTSTNDNQMPTELKINACNIFTANAGTGQNRETLVHELGHIFSISNNHVDQCVSTPSHLGLPDICVMSYNRNRLDLVVEFDYELEDSCIKIMRKASDPR